MSRCCTLVSCQAVNKTYFEKLNEGGVPTCFVGTNFHVLQTLIKSGELALELDKLSPDGLC